MPPAAYPPVVDEIEVLGYVSDINDRGYSRDIGRTFELGGKRWMHFGDTFCKDATGNFVGITSNTVASLPDSSNFLASKYLEIEKDGIVKPFIHPLPYEFTPDPDDPDNKDARLVLWSFGGVVELEDRTGRVFFEKSVVGGSQPEYCGTGIAKVSVHHGYVPPWNLTKWLCVPGVATREVKLHVERLMPNGCVDQWGMLFGPDEPRIGSLSTLVHGSFVYLWSLYKDKLILGRTPRCITTWTSAYTFWTGSDWVSNYTEAAPIDSMNDAKIAQGGVFYSESLFGCSSPFIFVGVNGYADSKIQVGVAEKVEGPWEIFPVGTATCIDRKDGFQYCIYPHTWASDEQNGELMVTWCEQWPGGVIAAKLKFQTVEEEKTEL